jgi:F-type H+-transporting ATPase subunit alpha
VELQIVSIYAGTKGHLDRLKVSAVRAFEVHLHRYAQQEAAATLSRIVETGTLDEQTEAELTQICKTAVERFLKEQPEASLAQH